MLITRKLEIFLIPPWLWGKTEKLFGPYRFSPCGCGCTLSWGRGFTFGLFGIIIHERWLSDDVIQKWRDGGELVITE